MRIMALDFGERTIGVAVSDELELTANPRTVLRRGPTELDQLAALVRAEEVGEVVVGLPISMSGEEGVAAQNVRRFVEDLGARLTVPVRTWDERLTTREAERSLIAQDMRRAQRRKVIDQVAAALILEGYLRYRALQGTREPGMGESE